MTGSLEPRKDRIFADEVEVGAYLGDAGCHVPFISHKTMERMRGLTEAYVGIFRPQTPTEYDSFNDPHAPLSRILPRVITVASYEIARDMSELGHTD